eukprot:m.512615 g.512615  ORF g.512615 m.512615 type:complete len:61 (+) comp105577_c0_seq1:493-675(+)
MLSLQRYGVVLSRRCRVSTESTSNTLHHGNEQPQHIPSTPALWPTTSTTHYTTSGQKKFA